MKRKILGWILVASVVTLVGHVIWSWSTAGNLEILPLLLLPLPLAGAERMLRQPTEPRSHLNHDT